MKIISLIALALVVGAALAHPHKPKPKPGLFASEVTTMEAVVEAINLETREVTLRQSDGTVTEIVAQPDVRNLSQVEVGDVLHVEYQQSLSIQVADIDGLEPEAGATSAMTRAKEGDMPGMATVDTNVIIAKVSEIDVDMQTYKLELPDGSIEAYKALNPENLKLAEVGDVVSIEVVEAVLAFVEDRTPSE